MIRADVLERIACDRRATNPPLGSPSLWRLSRLLLRETIMPRRLVRQPEPEAMDEMASVVAFHEQGDAGGALIPIYHFNAMALSRLIPAGGSLLDLGSGSGQFLAYLARVRPDIRITGLDLSPSMVEVGCASLKKGGLSNRVTLRAGDMTDFHALISQPVSAVSSVFALHHLPSEEFVRRCLAEVAALRRRDSCGVWIFDHVRPSHRRSAEEFPEIFTSGAPPIFREDSKNSLIASFTYDAIVALLRESGMSGFKHARSRIMSLYQAHWLEGSAGQSVALSCGLTHDARRTFDQLRKIMNVPLSTEQ